MSRKPMRIPWMATLTALMEELNRHLKDSVELDRKFTVASPKKFVRSVIEDKPVPESTEEPDASIRAAITHLLNAKRELEMASRHTLKLSMNLKDPRQLFGNLDDLDLREIRYPEWEGRKGLARFVERGGLFGPRLGQHNSQVISNESNLKRGWPYRFEEGRERRFAVKQIATIQHLYDVGLQKAVTMFCEHSGIDDPQSKEVEKLRQWVRRDRKEAKAQLLKGNLSERDDRHYPSILDGLRPSLPKGSLKDQLYPAALKMLLRETRP